MRPESLFVLFIILSLVCKTVYCIYWKLHKYLHNEQSRLDFANFKIIS